MADQLSFLLLGSPQILLDGTSLLSSMTRKAQALLIYLVMTPGSHSREALAGLLWPEMSTAKARNNLRTILHEVRVLRHTYLEITRQTIAFQHNSNYWLDVEILQTQLTGQLVESDLERWRTILALYRGDFLSGFHINDAVNFEEWVRTQREQLYTLFVNGTATLSQLALTHKAYAVGLAINSHLLTIAPTMEQAHLQQVRLLALSGRRSEALVQYDRCRQLLADEFQVEPSPALQELRTAILAGNESLYQEAITLPPQAQSRQAPAELLPALQQEPMPTQFLPLRPQRFSYVPEVGNFYGREAELATLHDWISEQRIHVVMILGIGGMGKTALAASFVRSLPPTAFRFVIWHSLLNAPPLAEILQSWIEILSEQTITQLPTSLDRQFDLLLEQLQQQRCLLILDNAESIMAGGEHSGMFRPGYEGYGQLLQWVAEQSHRSCLLLTSREEPYGIRERALKPSAIGMLRLRGLQGEPAGQLLQEQGLGDRTPSYLVLIERYIGNPLALKLAAIIIQELFGGDVQQFLARDSLLFDDIDDILKQHFARLTDNEMTLMYWLAIMREPVPFALLLENIASGAAHTKFLEALRSLRRRALLEQQGELLQLQNVVMEYVTNRLVALIHQEIVAFNVATQSATAVPSFAGQRQVVENALNRFPLVKAQAKEYIRASQARMLLQPVAEHLLAQWSKVTIADHIQAILDRLRAVAPLTPGYAAANLFHLLRHLQVDLRGYDFSRLVLHEADFRGQTLHRVNLAGANLQKARFTQPLESICKFVFSPDGQLLAGGIVNGTIRVWVCATMQVRWSLHGHQGPVWTVAFSHDSKVLASSAEDRTIRLWDMGTGKPLQHFQEPTSNLACLGFAKNTMRLFSMSKTGYARWWEVTPPTHAAQETPDPIFDPNVHYLRNVAFGNGWVAYDDSDAAVYIQDTQSGQLLAQLTEHQATVTALAASPDGSLLASSGKDNIIFLWKIDRERGKVTSYGRLANEPADVWERSVQIEISPDNSFLAVAVGHTIYLWQRETDATWQLCRRLYAHTATVLSLAFRPDGQRFVSVGYDYTVCLWDAKQGQQLARWQGTASSTDDVRWSPDGETVACSYLNHSVHLWDNAGTHRHQLQGHQRIRHMLYSADGCMLITAGDEQAIRVWHVASGQLRHILRGHHNHVNAIAISPQAPLVASVSSDGLVYLWNYQTGQAEKWLALHRKTLFALAFNHDGTRLATAGQEALISLWEMPTGQLLHRLQAHTGAVMSVAFRPDGEQFASCGHDKTICIWRVTDGQLLQRLHGHRVAVSRVLYSSDGMNLISFSEDWTLKVWGYSPVEAQWALRHTFPVVGYTDRGFALSPDSTTLAVGNIDGHVQLWDLQTGQLQQTLVGDISAITAVDFHPFEQTIVGCDFNGVVYYWNKQTGECIHVVRPEGPYAGMNITGVTGIPDAQRAALKALGAVDAEHLLESISPATVLTGKVVLADEHTAGQRL